MGLLAGVVIMQTFVTALCLCPPLLGATSQGKKGALCQALMQSSSQVHKNLSCLLFKEGGKVVTRQGREGWRRGQREQIRNGGGRWGIVRGKENRRG